MEKKTDRRVRKTKAQLRAGLAKLMQTKSIKEITVKELVDEVITVTEEEIAQGMLFLLEHQKIVSDT